MDFFAFLSTWFWYVMAFVAGALVAWLVARQFIRAETPEEAIEDALEARSGDSRDRSRESRARSTRFDERDERDLDLSDDDTTPRRGEGRFASLRRGATSLGVRR